MWVVSAMRVALLGALLALCSAAQVPAKWEKQSEEDAIAKVSAAELAHQRPFWRIGDGFEGSASDWTEYVVWLVGVIGVFYYLANPNARRNMHAIDDDESMAERFEKSDITDELFDGADDVDAKKEQ